MLKTSPEFSTFQIKEDDKFFSRLLSKESSMANPSFRVYYGGGSVAVPFVWESQPGTPKHTLIDTSIPPLTPPPSYFFHYNNPDFVSKKSKQSQRRPRSNLLHFLFSRLYSKKVSNVSSTAPSSSPQLWSPPATKNSWSSSNWNSISNSNSSFGSFSYRTTPRKYWKEHRRFSSSGSSFDSSKVFEVEEEDDHIVSSPTSTLCFGHRRARSSYGLRR